MSVEYRHPAPDEVAALAYADRIGFGSNTSEATISHQLQNQIAEPRWQMAAFEDGAPVSQIGTLPFTMQWGGREVQCGGVTNVSTLPSHRRRGHLRELMRRSLAEMREVGQPVSMLWASMAAIYQRFGFGIAYERRTYDFPPRLLSFVDALEPRGRTRLVKQDEAGPVLQPVYERFAAQRTLMLRRDVPELYDWWNRFIFRQWRLDPVPYLVAVYEEDGEALGYAIYGVEPGPEQPTGGWISITVRELIWLTPAAHRALVQYLAGHDIAYRLQFPNLPADDPLFAQAQEPRILGGKVADGTLVRIVDVEAALAARGYGTEGSLTFAVRDPLCPWNEGTWRLEVEGGSGAATRTREQPQLELDMRALTVLASGCRSAAELARAGMICPVEPAALRVAGDLFRLEAASLCLDMF